MCGDRKKQWRIRNLQPANCGTYQLHWRMDGDEVRGSPFPVTVKTPVDKLRTVIKTIYGVQKPHGVAVNKSGEVILAEADLVGY